MDGGDAEGQENLWNDKLKVMKICYTYTFNMLLKSLVVEAVVIFHRNIPPKAQEK